MAETSPALDRRPAITEIRSEHPGGLTLRFLPPRTRLSLRIDPKLLPPGVEVAGLALDMPINRRVARDGRAALRLGPDEWLLHAPESEAAQMAAEVEAALGGRHFSLVDVSHGRAGFIVADGYAPGLLNCGCPLDLSAKAFPVGRATRTLLGKCEVVLAKTDDRPIFEVECGRSFASYLDEFLLEAARGSFSPCLHGEGSRP